MTTILHTKIQGLRVNKLANLGGLVAIAGLENIDPAILLGTFLELTEQLPKLPPQHIEHLRATGLQKLHERKSEKRAYQQQNNSIELTLQLSEIKKLIVLLGGKIPIFEKDIIPELYRLMR